MSSAAAVYLEDVIEDVSVRAREMRRGGKTETKYFLSNKGSPSNLGINIGDIDKIDDGNYCVLLTEPSYYKGVVQGAASALVAVPDTTCDAFDALRAVIRRGCLEHKVLGAMTHEALFDLDASESMLEPIVRRKDDSERGAISLKFPDDARYYVIDFGDDNKPQLTQLRDEEQIRRYRRPGARFITHITFATMHTKQLCGCARYVKWVAFLPSDEGGATPVDDDSVYLGSTVGRVRVVEE